MQFTKHKASCVLEYNEDGSLVKCDFQPGTFDQQEYKLFFNNFPTIESKITVWKKQNFKTPKPQNPSYKTKIYNLEMNQNIPTRSPLNSIKKVVSTKSN